MSDPKTPEMTAPMMKRIITAGIEAMAHFTMNLTIDPKGMETSVTITCWRGEPDILVYGAGCVTSVG
jgi:hypothetical protein